MSNDKEVKLTITADASGAIKVLKETSGAVAGLGKSGKQIEVLDKELKDISSAASSVAKEADKATRSVGEFGDKLEHSGDAAVKSASDIKAVAKNLGGLSESTENVDRKLTQLVEGLAGLGISAQSIGGKFDAFISTLQKTDNSLRKTSKGAKEAKLSWVDFSTGLNQAWDALGRGYRLMGRGWEMAKQGVQLDEARQSFNRYTRSVGVSAEDMLSKLRRASGGTIDEMNLIVTASKAMSLGVTADSDRLANLLEIARNKARLFGVDTTKAFGDIVTGLGRQSPQILDNLGIRIPAAFDKMVEGMSDADKAAKLLELTLADGNSQLAAMGPLVNTAADDMRAFEVTITDLKSEGGLLLAEFLTPLADFLLKDGIPLLREFAAEAKIAAEAVGAAAHIAGLLFYTKGAGPPAGDLGEARSQLRATNEYIAENRRRMLEISPDGGSPRDYYGLREYLSLDAQMRELQDHRHRLKLMIKSFEKEAQKAAHQNRIDLVFATTEAQFKEIDDFWRVIEEEIAAGIKKTGETVTTQTKKELEKLKRESERISAVINKIPAADEKAVLGSFGIRQISDAKEAYQLAQAATLAAAGLMQTTSAVYEFETIFSPVIKDGEVVNETLIEFYETIKDIPPELKKFNEEMAQLASTKETLEDVFDVLKNFSKFDFVENINKLNLFDLADQQYAASMTVGMMNWLSAGVLPTGGVGLLTTDYSNKFIDVTKKDKQNLSKIIAEAVSSGFANADLTNFSMTIGQMLSSILSKSVAQTNPILNAAGGVNWGNVGINIGTNFVISALTQPGGIFGGRKEKYKAETLQAASDLRSQMGAAWVKSHETSLLPYLTYDHKSDLAAARYGYYGTRTGYSWSDSGGGWPFGSKTRTYNLIDDGASAALARLTEVMERAEKYNRSVEMSYELMTAQGYDYKALIEQTAIYAQAAAQARGDEITLLWTDGGKDTADLAEAAHELHMASAELTRQLATATAERFGRVAEGFATYAPWLDTIPLRMAIGGGLRASMRGEGMFSTGFGGAASFLPEVDVSSLSTSQLYDAFADIQTAFFDREISPYLLDIVKQAGTKRFDLESLRLTDVDAWQTEYTAMLDRQLEAFEEVMRRQEAVFLNEAKSYEERAAALEELSQTIENYHQVKLEKLRREQELEAEEKRMLEERRHEQFEAAMFALGEVNQRLNLVVNNFGADPNAAADEVLAILKQEFRDDPDIMSVLQGYERRTTGLALWGKDA